MSESPTQTSSSSTSTSTSSSAKTTAYRPKKVLVPKVWKRPHSTIYGKNVEFGSSLYSDKIGELNGRKFNSELPWSVRNSANSASASTGLYSQSGPYGQSTDGRKLSLGSINPQSYRPSLPQKTSLAQASDGEEFELQDKSSPFYTDRWAGKTIRHFDSDLYSNASLFKSMIL